MKKVIWWVIVVSLFIGLAILSYRNFFSSKYVESYFFTVVIYFLGCIWMSNPFWPVEKGGGSAKKNKLTLFGIFIVSLVVGVLGGYPYAFGMAVFIALEFTYRSFAVGK